MEQYRVENDSVYEYDEKARAYLFCGSLMGRTLNEFLRDLSERDESDEADDAQ
jgi:hypothetical protein